MSSAEGVWLAAVVAMEEGDPGLFRPLLQSLDVGPIPAEVLTTLTAAVGEQDMGMLLVGMGRLADLGRVVG